MPDPMQEIIDKAVAEAEKRTTAKFVRILMEDGATFDEALERLKIPQDSEMTATLRAEMNIGTNRADAEKA